MQEIQAIQVQSLGWKDPLEKGMVIHSSILAWSIPWTEEPGGLESMGSQRVRHDWSNLAHTQSVFLGFAWIQERIYFLYGVCLSITFMVKTASQTCTALYRLCWLSLLSLLMVTTMTGIPTNSSHLSSAWALDAMLSYLHGWSPSFPTVTLWCLFCKWGNLPKSTAVEIWIQ